MTLFVAEKELVSLRDGTEEKVPAVNVSLPRLSLSWRETVKEEFREVVLDADHFSDAVPEDVADWTTVSVSLLVFAVEALAVSERVRVVETLTECVSDALVVLDRVSRPTVMLTSTVRVG